MLKRILGKTEFEVSVIGFGGIPIQKVDKDTAIKLITKASEEGINFIDTATGYGKSEELIGYGIESVGREKWIVATKCPVRDYEGMKEKIKESLDKLKVDCIDLYQLHNVKTKEQYNKVMGEDGALKALKEAKENGLIKEIGITSHDLHILEKAVETEEFSTIQFPYNPVETRAETLFKRANELNIGVIVMKPIAGGAITNVNYSLRFILENEDVTTVIPGMKEIKHIEDNASVGNKYVALSSEERNILLDEAKELGTEFCRRCGYCQPCPQGIDIASQFVLEGYLLRYDLEKWAKKRYSGLEHTADECIECGECENKCPYDLPIREMLKRVNKNFS
ncbi:MAG: aldo/keto reductase [Firmicutes bacterium]|nr:aldo/keto reductase [Bacillota bacterium]